MNIKEMHYDFKQKLNKIDSQQYRNLRVPEIDWKINEAYEVFVKSIAEPRVNNHLGFDVESAIDYLADKKNQALKAQIIEKLN